MKFVKAFRDLIYLTIFIGIVGIIAQSIIMSVEFISSIIITPTFLIGSLCVTGVFLFVAYAYNTYPND